VAVPDFSGGAMENWGLVLYRETALLYEQGVSSSENKLMVTLIIAHEIAHTWFGNMVTMKWWDDLWLNEGFASLLMYFAMDAIYPDWNVFTLSVVAKEVFPVMVKDAMTTSHPVSTPIDTPDDIAESFDSISYSKGMAILRMLMGFVGWEDFQKGLRLYVNRFKFRNAKMDELWDTFSEAVDYRYDIKSTMNTWTRQMGFPVITMQTEGDSYNLTQERFLYLDNMADSNTSQSNEDDYK
ncbi:glutamyl aminopeptidase-like, partial [Saccostrea cucullata]|uniref:glutamyl aminopeptidase-like n=1 Tax=Saccostrea cuccullata TaxID=36930 RepID=UPI002ED460A2